MIGATSRTRRNLLGTAAIGTVVCALSMPAAAQMARPTTPTSTFDKYNNARPHYRERRQLHFFGNDTQREILRGIQSDNRRANRRGGLLPFSLTGRGTAGAARASSLLSLRPRANDTFSLGRAGAFSRFGNRRRTTAPMGTAAAAMERRRSLLVGSSRNAPIFRALERRRGGGFSAQTALERTPFVPADSEAIESNEPETHLRDFFATKTKLAQSRLDSDAWEHFRDGKYIDAARSFGTATRMDPSRNASRVGELLCHFIVRANQTGLAVFKELVRHDTELFRHELQGGVQSVASLFQDPRQIGRLRSNARLRIGPSESSKDVRAMHMLVLWYLGERSEAKRGAVSLAREFPESVYANWPSKMGGATD